MLPIEEQFRAILREIDNCRISTAFRMSYEEVTRFAGSEADLDEMIKRYIFSDFVNFIMKQPELVPLESLKEINGIMFKAHVLVLSEEKLIGLLSRAFALGVKDSFDRMNFAVENDLRNFAEDLTLSEGIKE